MYDLLIKGSYNTFPHKYKNIIINVPKSSYDANLSNTNNYKINLKLINNIIFYKYSR